MPADDRSVGADEKRLDNSESLDAFEEVCREKSPSQIAREGSELQRIESVRSERRRLSTLKQNADTDESNWTQRGRTDELVAKELGMSTGTWKRLKLVFEKAKQGDENAQGLVKSLDAGTISVHGAYQATRQ